MVDSDIALVVRFCVICSTLLVICIPFLLVRKIYREKAVGSASLIPIVLGLANSHVWMMYGYLGRKWLLGFLVFLFGDIVSVCYLYIFWRYSDDRRQVAQTISIMFAWLAVPTFYVIVGSLGLTDQTRAQVWKTHGLCFCGVTVVISHLLMLKNLLRAIYHRSAASIVPRSLAVTTIDTCGWFAFGLMTSNWIIAGPQVFVITLHVAAWTIYVVFTHRTSPKNAMYVVEEGSVMSILRVLPEVHSDVHAGMKEAPTSFSVEYCSLRSPLQITNQHSV
uniref:Bidirectional sugar transporter SWEET n=1 Tax=Peronospora matthiolae TaxID=2874970 RepID=A0AAV1TCM8_9STRA